MRGLGCESKSGKGIHDQVDPEHLSGGKGRLAEEAGACEHNEHSDDIDGELELEELAHVVIDVTTEKDGCENGAEVIIHELDIASILGNISASDSHSETNVRSVQGGSIVGTITGHSNSFSFFDQTIDEHEFVIGLGASHNLKLFLDNLEYASV